MKKMMNRKQFLRTLPRKRIASGALLFDSDGSLLMVKPNYKDHWSIPGGTSDKNESPLDTCIREVKEEIGLLLGNLKLASVTYLYDRRMNDESVQFLFTKDVLSEEEISEIKIKKDELDNYKFIPINEIVKYNKNLSVVVKKFLKTKKPIYLHEIR